MSYIKVEDLSLGYDSEIVCSNINFEINKNDYLCIIGENGAGKSTTIKILLGLNENYSGEVKIFGQDIKNQDYNFKKNIGYVPEVAKLYENLTAREYLTFIGQLYNLSYDDCDKKAHALMEILGIEHAYESRLSSFSKGMKQKVLIISALMHNPDILFLDEPLSGLDANSVLVIKEIISKLRDEGKTIFYSSHIMEVVEKISDRILLLKDGRIIADGNFEEIKKLNNKESLEEVFNDLTGFEDHSMIADKFVKVIKEV
mgnify:CR=1 FL=1